ncbi:MAG: DUF1905 domain-containing protein [Flavobacteriales bacterium]|nr:DUF1905 domain-containing protein [Flavobacteriales bacterium]
MTAPVLLAAFTAKIHIIGINPYVLLPDAHLQKLFAQADKEKGPIPVHGTLDGHAFIQTLVKYAGHWRLYVNGPMLKTSRKAVGDHVSVRIAFDPEERTTPASSTGGRAENQPEGGQDPGISFPFTAEGGGALHQPPEERRSDEAQRGTGHQIPVGHGAFRRA